MEKDMILTLMRLCSKKWVALVALFFSAALFSGCGGGGGGGNNTSQPPTVTLIGTAKDKSLGTPLVGYLISVQGTAISATTTAGGAFTLPGVANTGTVTLTLSTVATGIPVNVRSLALTNVGGVDTKNAGAVLFNTSGTPPPPPPLD